MIREDARGRKVAIVADYLINPGSALYAGAASASSAAMDVLSEDGWGMMKPPPHVLPESVGRPAVATLAGDAVDYQQHGYTVVVLAVEGLPQGGVWLNQLETAFRELGAAMPRVALLSGKGACTAADIRAALGRPA